MHNDSASAARFEYCGATREHYTCRLERGHSGYHVADGGPGCAGFAWQAEEPAKITGSWRLTARAPWEPHRFPERRADGTPRYLERKVTRARQPYPCGSLEPAPEHRATIARGERYLRVSVPPSQRPGGLGRWRKVRLCRACAIAYELATLEPQEAPS